MLLSSFPLASASHMGVYIYIYVNASLSIHPALAAGSFGSADLAFTPLHPEVSPSWPRPTPQPAWAPTPCFPHASVILNISQPCDHPSPSSLLTRPTSCSLYHHQIHQPGPSGRGPLDSHNHPVTTPVTRKSDSCFPNLPCLLRVPAHGGPPC